MPEHEQVCVSSRTARLAFNLCEVPTQISILSSRSQSNQNLDHYQSKTHLPAQDD